MRGGLISYIFVTVTDDSWQLKPMLLQLSTPKIEICFTNVVNIVTTALSIIVLHTLMCVIRNWQC